MIIQSIFQIYVGSDRLIKSENKIFQTFDKQIKSKGMVKKWSELKIALNVSNISLIQYFSFESEI